ncbi:uncharacterized protein LOC134224649 [Armigeres subalbatus]|uniref:uncharacterized protein LOC134224649 n=1 Tax=Armigeres subalbatus TaxID=124917 RepID=UPI002ED21032
MIPTHNLVSSHLTSTARLVRRTRRPYLPPDQIKWNINGFWNNLPNQELLTHDSPPWIIGLQELNRVTLNSMDLSLEGKYKWAINVGPNIRHSVAIGVHRDVPFDEHFPVVGVRLRGSFLVSVVNVYLPCGNLPGIIRKVSNIINESPSPVLLLRDMNAHHPAWGDFRTDPRGTALLESFETADLVLLNHGAATFFNGHSLPLVDLFYPLSSQWEVSSDLSGSNHFPISVTVHASLSEITQRPRWRYDAYDLHVRRMFERNTPTTLPEFTQTVLDAAVACISQTSNRT